MVTERVTDATSEPVDGVEEPLRGYQNLIGSWAFFSICTSISVLSLLKRFGTLHAHGWLDGVIDLYTQVASSLACLSHWLPLHLSEMDSLIFVSWTSCFAPALVAIYRHLRTPEGKRYFVVGVLAYLAFILVGVSGDSGGGGWERDVLGNLLGVFGFATITVALSTRGGWNRLRALGYFVKNLIGATIVCALLVLAGLADLVT